MGRMGILGVLCALACTSVHMVQRDGCWLKKTETTLGGSREELGFCAKPAPAPADDRMSQLVQECMAQADFRWQNRAIAAWNRGEPIPPQEDDADVARTCMSEVATALGTEAQNGALKERVAELTRDREALRGVADKDREFLQQSSDKMVTALGEAAKKPAPSATATATSTGTAKTDSDAPQGTPAVTVVGLTAPGAVELPKGPAPAAACAAKGRRVAHKLAKDRAGAPGCEKAPEPEPIPVPPAPPRAG